jgi:hypothetical protein
VVRLLRDWFDRYYHKLNQDETRDIVLPRVETKDDRGCWLGNVKCVHGHFDHGRGYGLPYYYPEIDQYFTILRDPFDLVVSMYFFAKGRSARGQFWFRGEPVDLRDQFPNVESYVRTYPYWLFNHLPQDITLANYEEKLEDRFVYIGIFEDLQTSIDNLGLVLGKPQTQLPKFNVSTYVYQYALEHYREPNVMPEATRLAIEQAEQADREALKTDSNSSLGVA